MKTVSIFTLAFATLLKLIAADSEPFGVISSHSASKVHLLPPHDSGNGLLIGTGSGGLGLTITDDGKVKFNNGKYAVVNDEGRLNDGDENNAVTGFSITDGLLRLNGNNMFYAVPTDDSTNYEVYVKEVSDSTFFYFVGTTGDNNSHYSFEPKDNQANNSAASSSVSSTTSSTSVPSTTLQSSRTDDVTTTVSQISSTKIQSTIALTEQTENGAMKLDFVFNAGIAGIAAFLL